MWGFGGLTWGLMIRYLGVGLGLALGAGLASAAGTLVPKAIQGEFFKLFETNEGIASFVGVLVSLLGIIIVGMAGMSKEKELPEEEKKKAVAEFNFPKGILVAIFSGLMSAGMGLGLQGGKETEFKAWYGSGTQAVKQQEKSDPAPTGLRGQKGLLLDKDAGYWVLPQAPPGEETTSKTWRGLPVLVVVLLGGFLVNCLWCLYLNFKNKTTGDYRRSGNPLIANFFFAGLAGALWCSQFICFKTGETAMGGISYVGWAVLMASMIMFGTLLGIFLGEWKGTSRRTRKLLAAGLLLLLLSSVIGFQWLSQAAPGGGLEHPGGGNPL